MKENLPENSLFTLKLVQSILLIIASMVTYFENKVAYTIFNERDFICGLLLLILLLLD